MAHRLTSLSLAVLVLALVAASPALASEVTRREVVRVRVDAPDELRVGRDAVVAVRGLWLDRSGAGAARIAADESVVVVSQRNADLTPEAGKAARGVSFVVHPTKIRPVRLNVHVDYRSAWREDSEPHFLH